MSFAVRSDLLYCCFAERSPRDRGGYEQLVWIAIDQEGALSPHVPGKRGLWAHEVPSPTQNTERHARDRREPTTNRVDATRPHVCVELPRSPVAGPFVSAVCQKAGHVLIGGVALA